MSIMRKIFKALIVLGSILILSPTTPSFAAGTMVNETEPNNTMDTANYVTRNQSTPAQAVDGSYSGEFFMKASGKKDDDDWFRFTLPAKTDSYLSFVSDSGLYNITVFDEDSNIIGSNEYKAVLGKTIFNLNIKEEGTYYLQIYCRVGGSYKFSIGNPNYTIGNYNYSLGSLSFVKDKDYEITKDFSQISAVPKGAIVYNIDLDGGSGSLTKAAQLKTARYTSWINTPRYVWKSNLPVNYTSEFHQSWYFKYTPVKTGTLIAGIKFRYVYPLLPPNEVN